MASPIAQQDGAAGAPAFAFTLWHRLTAALVFLVSLALYSLTMSPTASFWDCGEFIASSYSLSVPHPPGAPFFLLLGRLFTMLPTFADIGARVNFISVLTSALTVLLLYLTIVHLIRYWKPKEQMGWVELAGAALGALAFMASDSFWFNAVEAEVYAISMLFTALVVWLAFVWHDLELRGRHDSDRIFLLIFYLVGLAIGIHLLNVLALPLFFLVVYFHWQEGRPFKPEHFMLFWGLSVLSILPVYPGVVLWLPKLVKALESAGGDWLALAGLVVLLGLLAALHVAGRRRGNRPLALGAAALLLVVLGYLSYVLILVRSGLNPPLDENDPQTLAGLIAYLSREQYGSESIASQLFDRKAPFWDYQIHHMYIRYFNWNFIGRDVVTEAWNWRLLGLPLLVGLWGLATHFARDWKRAFTLGNLFLLTGLAIVIYLNQENPQPRERDYAYVGSFYAFAIWIGLGAWTLLDELGRLAKRGGALLQGALALALAAAMPANMVWANYHTHDRSGNYVAQDYARNALGTLPQDAIIFTNGDNDTFPLWYLQIVEGFRTDVRVVNLSLLNTGWYVRQLRDVEPRVPIPPRFTDDYVAKALDGGGDEAFYWRYWGPEMWRDPAGNQLPEDLWYLVPLRDAKGETIAVRVPPTMKIEAGDGAKGPNFLRVQDRMILEIVRANAWRRPVFFAVTVARDNFVGLDRHLRMDGLAYRVMDHPMGDRDIDVTELGRSLDFISKHLRGLNDPAVYFDDNIQKLVQNYRSAYIQQALELDRLGRRREALAVLTTMDASLPESVLPPINTEMSLQLGLVFERLGRPEALRARLEAVDPATLSQEDRFYWATMWIDPLKEPARGLAVLDSMAESDPTQQIRLETARMLEAAGLADSAAARYRRVLLDKPDLNEAVAGLVRSLEKGRHWQEAITLLQDWLKKHPDDPAALRRLDRYQAKLDSTRRAAPRGGEAASR